MAIKIITDSTCDLDFSLFEDNRDILRFIGMPVNIEGVDYVDDLGKTLTHDVIYEKLRNGVFPKTSQINVTSFLDCYKAFYKEGDTVFVLLLSSGLSGTINNAVLAKKMFDDDKREADIRVIDTVAGSIGLGAIIVEVMKLIRNNTCVDTISEWINNNIIKINHWFAIDDLEHLRQGGRINKTAAMIGTALKVKPILMMTHTGKLEMYSTVRGRIKSIKFLLKKLEDNYMFGSGYSILIGHANCLEDAKKFKNMIEETYKMEEIIVSELSATIATHVGPGMLAVAFVGKDVREEK